MTEPIFRSGDIYEDCSFHPCLCIAVDGDTIQGVSLIDGSSPRTCSLSHCGIRKLSLEEALFWKSHGPQDMPEGCKISPNRQWWWPKPPQAINTGSYVEHLFGFSFMFVGTHLRQQLGEEIDGWYSASSAFDDTGKGSSRATVTYLVKSNQCSAKVFVEAEKEGRLWPIRKITVLVSGETKPLVFEGEDVRGCGYAG
jgi:hypothetical protein